MSRLRLILFFSASTMILSCSVDQGGLGYGEPCSPGAEEFCFELGDGRTTGQCQPGTRTCGPDGVWSACDGEIIPETERCDGADRLLDYDCDGAPANGCDCTAGETQTCLLEDQVGACRGGRQTCDAQTNWGPCEVVLMPGDAEEVCNLPLGTADGDLWMYDENCDGEVDEGFRKTSYYSDGDGDLYGINEIQLCPGEPAPEGFASEGGDCDDTDMGINPGESDNDCDAVDEDCDNNNDEGFPSTPTSCGVGACGATGQIECVVGEEVDTCEAGQPANNDRSCDNVDDDCDGSSDEGYVSETTSCGQGACAATGSTSCNNGRVEDSCSAAMGSQTDRLCDGIDNDCNGSIDEDYQSRAVMCGVGACVAMGQTQCSNGTEVDDCTPGSPSPDNNCDGVDDDCDNMTDEDFGGATTMCGVGLCMRTGTLTCTGGAEVDSCTPGTATTTVDDNCDGVDDDCDGMNDEDGGTMYQWDNDSDGYLRDNPPSDWISPGCGSAPMGQPTGGDPGGEWIAVNNSDPDCDDNDPDVHPGASDVCGLDRDCIPTNDAWDFCNCGSNATVDCRCKGRVIDGTQFVLCEFTGNRNAVGGWCQNIGTIRNETIALAEVDSGSLDTQIDSWMNMSIWGSSGSGRYSSDGAYFGLRCNIDDDPSACMWDADGSSLGNDFNDFRVECGPGQGERAVVGRNNTPSGTNCGDAAGRYWWTSGSSRGFLCQVL